MFVESSFPDPLPPTPTATIPEATPGGGFAVLQRNSVGRLRAPRCPYEHASAQEAVTEADRRAHQSPGREFVVVEVVHSALLRTGVDE